MTAFRVAVRRNAVSHGAAVLVVIYFMYILYTRVGSNIYYVYVSVHGAGVVSYSVWLEMYSADVYT